MKYFEIHNKEELNAFAASQKQASFLQSWEWGEFQAGVGNKVIRQGFEDNDGGLFFALSLIKKNLPAGKSYLYAPRLDFGNLTDKQLRFVFDAIKRIAKKEKAIFLRFEPETELGIMKQELRIVRTIDVQPSKTIILDLSKTEDELLKNMHAKTRYNIRLAEKKGVVIREGGERDFEKFWEIMEDTKERDGFRVHGKGYYRKMLVDRQQTIDDRQQTSDNRRQTTGNRQQSDADLHFKLSLAEFKGKIIAGNIVSFFGDMVTYVHGASSNEFRNVMAPYLLQWRTIQAAKGLGYKYYDFYGIDEAKWPGVTRFKKGFGGRDVSYPGTFDLVFEGMWYNVYKMARRVRRM